MPLGADLIIRTLIGLAAGTLSPLPQSPDGVTYAAKLSKEEARIDWSRDAEGLRNQIRGLNPAPMAWTMLGGERLRILAAEAIDATGVPGVALDEALTIACGTRALRLLEVQRDGGKPMRAADFLRGRSIPAGTRLS
jgi:methionyl-tRNA formyltransferase